MATRMKEDEKNERIIRGLLKQPENRKCINCNSLGPQYVCTNFWTFVCITCSGIHREFTHRVKSVSMAKFTSQEVSSLQQGGNERAKELYFKEWDPQRHSFPDSSNIERLRDFIKHVYVDRRYSGERSFDKPPRGKMGDKEELYENRKMDSYLTGSRSPQYEDSYGRRHSDQRSPGGRSDDKNSRYGYDGRRSPGSDLESRQHGDYRRSPARLEIVNDWRREDRFGNGRKSDRDTNLGGRSPDHQKDLDASSPPMVRPVREILGDNVSPLRVIEPPKANGGRVTEGFAHTQRTASSSSLGSSNGNPGELKRENSGILIDFDADPEPPVAATVSQTQQPPVQTIAQPTRSSNDNNWASFDFATEAKVLQAPSNVNALETVLSQLSLPASVPGPVSGVPNIGGGGPAAAAPVGNLSVLPMNGVSVVPSVQPIPTSPFLGGAPAPASFNTFAAFPPTAAAAPGLTSTLPGHDGNSFFNVTDIGQWPSMQHQQPSLFPDTGGQSIAQQFAPSGGGTSTSQQWNSPLLPNSQGPSIAPAAQAPQAVSKPQMVTSSLSSGPLPVEVKPTGRKELPEDLFATTYQPFSMQVPGWHTGPPYGMGFNMQYHTAMPLPSTFSHSTKSTNPFDLNSEPPLAQAPTTFPSMISLPGSLPNMPPSMNLPHTSGAATQSAWIPGQSSLYPLAMPPQAPPYASGFPPRAYMGQQVPGAITPSSHQGVGGFGTEDAVFSSLNANQLSSGRYSAPAAVDKLPSTGGNPFG